MAHPCLAFCPYLTVNELIEFADWELGPASSISSQVRPRISFLRQPE